MTKVNTHHTACQQQANTNPMWKWLGGGEGGGRERKADGVVGTRVASPHIFFHSAPASLSLSHFLPHFPPASSPAQGASFSAIPQSKTRPQQHLAPLASSPLALPLTPTPLPLSPSLPISLHLSFSLSLSPPPSPRKQKQTKYPPTDPTCPPSASLSISIVSEEKFRCHHPPHPTPPHPTPHPHPHPHPHPLLILLSHDATARRHTTLPVLPRRAHNNNAASE